jgi:hypothetical protein
MLTNKIDVYKLVENFIDKSNGEANDNNNNNNNEEELKL